ncbi:hypothetical protein QCA50_019595 [Cerrena zonata]|uniref:Uncharacterized protein n=1 Tax=Cerrena zonata TaxID=2478898 RepID=A0AAW0FC24_9APHY
MYMNTGCTFIFPKLSPPASSPSLRGSKAVQRPGLFPRTFGISARSGMRSTPITSCIGS